MKRPATRPATKTSTKATAPASAKAQPRKKTSAAGLVAKPQKKDGPSAAKTAQAAKKKLAKPAEKNRAATAAPPAKTAPRAVKAPAPPKAKTPVKKASKVAVVAPSTQPSIPAPKKATKAAPAPVRAPRKAPAKTKAKAKVKGRTPTAVSPVRSVGKEPRVLTANPIEYSTELGDILQDAMAAEKALIQGADEPLVAVCRRVIQGNADAGEALAAFLSDRTIRGVVYRQGMRYRLSEADCEDLLQELGLMFHTKLLPTLRDAEKIWSVAAITARRLAAGKADRTREVALEGMVSDRFDSAGHFSTTDGATARMTDLLNEAAGQVEIPHEDVDRRLDREKAIAKFTRLVAAVGADPMKAVYAEDGMEVGQAHDPDDLKRASPSLKAGAAAMTRLGFSGVFKYNASDPSPDTVRARIERMPISYGQRLAKIRLDLGMSVKDFASTLNTTEGSMAQFLTCVAGTPVRVWEDAQVLLAQGAPEHDALVRRFGSKSMKDIVGEWLQVLTQRLGRPALQADLAKTLGVYKSTVSRWSGKGHRPELKEIAEFEEVVQGRQKPQALRRRGRRPFRGEAHS